MSVSGTSEMPVGVRAVTGERRGRLTWVAAGAGGLERGSRVIVHDAETDAVWLGEVVVLPDQVLESPPLPAMPTIIRLVEAADAWPILPDRAGRGLLDALALPSVLLESATG